MVERKCMQCGKKFKTHQCQIKRGGGKFCSLSCSTTYRNIVDNPTKSEAVRLKISLNHADVSGERNPMYGRKGEKSPAYIDGRNLIKGAKYQKLLVSKGIAKKCFICGSVKNVEVHHIDGNRRNNDFENLVYLCRHCHLTKAHKYARDKKGKFISSMVVDLKEEVM